MNRSIRDTTQAIAKLVKHPAFKAAVTISVLVMITKATLILADQSTAQLLSLSFLLAVSLATFYRFVNPVGWALVLRGMGHQVDTIAAVDIWLRAESRRWLPGGIWGYASRATQSNQMGVPVARASASMLIEMVLTMTAAAVVGLAGILMYRHEFSAVIRDAIESLPRSRFWLIAAAITFAGCFPLMWVARKKLVGKYRSIREKAGQLDWIQQIAGRLLPPLGYLIAMAVLNGAVNQVLLGSLDGGHEVPFAATVAATAIAWVIGLLAVFAPGGLMVREAALATLLLPWLPYPLGLALAVQSRFAQVVAELICMVPLYLPRFRSVSVENA